MHKNLFEKIFAERKRSVNTFKINEFCFYINKRKNIKNSQWSSRQVYLQIKRGSYNHITLIINALMENASTISKFGEVG